MEHAMETDQRALSVGKVRVQGTLARLSVDVSAVLAE
jgi:hypothetical protein